jgi:hypothetical protein
MSGAFTTARLDLSDTFHFSISAVRNPSKNEGPTHDVIENTGPCFGTRPRPHDTFENKRLILESHDVLEKYGTY